MKLTPFFFIFVIITPRKELVKYRGKTCKNMFQMNCNTEPCPFVGQGILYARHISSRIKFPVTEQFPQTDNHYERY